MASLLNLNFKRIFNLWSKVYRTEWSPIRSVITRVITKSNDHAAGVRFVYHKYDYRPRIGQFRILTVGLDLA